MVNVNQLAFHSFTSKYTSEVGWVEMEERTSWFSGKEEAKKHKQQQEFMNRCLECGVVVIILYQ